MKQNAAHIKQFASFSLFHSFSRVKMNSINWPAPNVWVFIAQLVEHCSANAEAMGPNPIEAPKIFFSGLILDCLNCDYNCDDHIFISFVFLQFTSFSFCSNINNIWDFLCLFVHSMYRYRYYDKVNLLRPLQDGGQLTF